MKLSEIHRFSDESRGTRSSLIRLDLFDIRSKIWSRPLNLVKVSGKYLLQNQDSVKQETCDLRFYGGLSYIFF